MKCRHCSNILVHNFLDLGFAPPSNAYLTEGHLNRPEKYYPLRVKVCEKCWLVQTEDYAEVQELFDDNYAYFSSTSSTWLAHASDYVKKMTKKLSLNSDSFVVEVASNDGYLLKNFVAAGIPCLGIEPTASTAMASEKLGILVLREFFGEQLGERLVNDGRQADLVIGNNVYAHVPDINDFTRGLKAILKPNGVVTLEFPHLMKLIEHAQFDTVYHEHFSYLSLYTVNRIFNMAGLRVWDVKELSTHGGSLRVYGCHFDNSFIATTDAVDRVLAEETAAGLQNIMTYELFQSRADKIKNDLVAFLVEVKKIGKKLAAYGAAAKGNTLLNYAGIKPDLVPFVCDMANSKQGKYMPGSHIPIFSPSVLTKEELDYLLILPWNVAEEVMKQNIGLEKNGTRFVIAIPEMRIL